MKSFRLCLALAAALFATPVLAQDAPADNQPAQQNKQPKMTEEKSFTDWAVRCYDVKSPTPCEMSSFRIMKKTGQRVLGVSFAYAPSRDASVVLISVPLGVSFANGVILETDTYKSPAIGFRYCNQIGCFVQAILPKDVLAQLTRATKAQVDVVLVDGRRLPLKMSLTGFGEAHNTMVELARSKVKGPAPATTPEP